jgi:hypothetical protein
MNFSDVDLWTPEVATIHFWVEFIRLFGSLGDWFRSSLGSGIKLWLMMSLRILKINHNSNGISKRQIKCNLGLNACHLGSFPETDFGDFSIR